MTGDDVLKLLKMTEDAADFMEISDYPALEKKVKTCRNITAFLEVASFCTLIGWAGFAVSRRVFIFNVWFPFQHSDYPKIYWIELVANSICFISPVSLR